MKFEKIERGAMCVLVASDINLGHNDIHLGQCMWTFNSGVTAWGGFVTVIVRLTRDSHVCAHA
jgi:hypothetical protein